MSLVSAVIADIRVEINDSDSTRFTNDTATILPLLKQAVRRANRICQRSQLHFAKKSAVLQTVDGENSIDLPTDIDIPIGIWRQDYGKPITQKNEGDWEETAIAGGVWYWFLDLENNKLLLKDTPTTAIDLKFWYFPTVDPSAYTAASTMPWSGKLDDIIARYVALRIQNIEEANTAQDQRILDEMEQSITAAYAPLSPLRVSGGGWL